eukprot:CAMPEP_0176190386 /NCGR_PEP_ID=MMETSP0121_2-20121125/3913_1 /TAXON_ID=160619 /ORGANISM="Kryptoperidinium foliaceum, Strain CCMP 1326" /LENGTH=168 /DNA_ID=CAMNT_0017529009 /DNA_START=181 /DNA_END=684 /DNA_ORIENTATION=+
MLRQLPHCTVSAAAVALTGLPPPGLLSSVSDPEVEDPEAVDGEHMQSWSCVAICAARAFLQQHHQTQHPAPSKQLKLITMAATSPAPPLAAAASGGPRVDGPEVVDGDQMQNWSSQRSDMHLSQVKPQQSKAEPICSQNPELVLSTHVPARAPATSDASNNNHAAVIL